MDNFQLIFKSIFVISLFCFLSCSKTNIDESLINCWIHSIEESEENMMVFRLCDSENFPPAWFRQSFTLSEEGVAEYLILAPNDGHYNVEAIWETDEEVLRIEAEGNVVEFEILEISNDKLVLNLN